MSNDGYWSHPSRVGVDPNANERKPDRPKKKKELEARCHSAPCNGGPGRKSRSFTIKKVTKNTVFCPDCRHALFWAVKGSKSGW